MIYTALIGNPTDHSVSHIMYEMLLSCVAPGCEYSHLKINLSPDELKGAVDGLKSLHFRGFNVTLPYKLEIIPFLDSIDETAQKVGAINAVKIGKRTCGYNTDWQGFYLPIRDVSKTITNVTIFGSGGAARAAIYAAKILGAKQINVFYRAGYIDVKTQELINQSSEIGIEMHTYEKIKPILANSELVINATSTGMIGNQKTPFNLESINELDMTGKIFFDAVFNPLNTPLLSYFKSKGAHTIDGLWMMIYQGIASLSLWLGEDLAFSTEKLNVIHNELSRGLK